jgi:hypothetical protein
VVSSQGQGQGEGEGEGEGGGEGEGEMLDVYEAGVRRHLAGAAG